MSVRGGTVDAEFERRVDAVSWGVLLVVLGGVLLVPDAPEELWLVAVGGAMLGISGVRVALGLPVGWFTVVVGTGALVWGGAAVFGFPEGAAALALLAVGSLIVVGELMRSRRPSLSPPAHE